MTASNLLKSRSQVQQNSTASILGRLGLATNGELVASFCWSRKTRIGMFEGNSDQNHYGIVCNGYNDNEKNGREGHASSDDTDDETFFRLHLDLEGDQPTHRWSEGSLLRRVIAPKNPNRA